MHASNPIHNSLIRFLEEELGKKLPGPAFQQRMAPSDRHARNLKTASRGKSVDAAVLICLWFRNSRIYTVLIKRNTYNGPHSGQISFPGGKREAGDKTLAETALRETFEEVGLKKEEVQLLGSLTELDIPVSGFRVFPFVGYLPSIPRFHPDPSEVVEIIETDLRALHNARTLTMTYTKEGQKHSAPYYPLGTYKLWGATAMIMSEFLEILRRAGY